MLNQITSKNYYIGISWFILSLISSVINDTITKFTGIHLPAYQVSFLRFFFSMITLLPIVLYYGINTLKSERPIIHLVRGSLFFIGITIWTKGLMISSISTATLISFTIPLFTLILAKFFLNENITWQRWIATLVGFIGIIIIIEPHSQDFNPQILVLLFSAVLFATLDIINKKYVIKETMLSMLFYSALVTTGLSLYPAINCWIQPTTQELIMLFILGISANLILFLILKAFVLVDATAIAPYRYLELVFSIILGYFMFNEIPHISTFIGAMVVIPATLFVSYSEKK